jgi:hypothetical protein
MDFTIQEAIAAAKRYLQEVYSDALDQDDVRVEEIRPVDPGVDVTVSFNGPQITTPVGQYFGKREYKVIFVSRESDQGGGRSMRMREMDEVA